MVSIAALSRLSLRVPTHARTNSDAEVSWRGPHERHLEQMLENIRNLVLAPPANCERFHVVFLDRHRSYLGVSYFTAGRLDGYTLRLRDLFVPALSLDARSMIVAHNHPSGDCRPSDHDIRATQHVATLANALEIELIDHLIFTTTQVYSMRGRVIL